MAGFFRQLVERVLDPVTTLHPVRIAAPAFGQDTFETAAASIPEVTESPYAPVRHAQEVRRDTASFDAPIDQSTAGIEHAIQQPIGSSRESEDASRVAMSAPVREVTAIAHARETSPPPPTDATMSTPIIAHHDRHEQVTPDPMIPRRQSAMRIEAPSRSSALPTPIRPLPAQVRPAPRSRAQQTDTQAAPEVHIHIGRIELTAVAPTKPPRREPAAGKKPMSLDEYLQQRGRKAP